eukprot:CAMPEP_0167760582 /NCGR_PEP_ID=MMETSP0110_2-20121227/11666_1 /TAXON_ID=629695 /ORGANISM="Gymnochlora sp., Strain CCMP2014" /LENGTH=375 /DNA_ID=CAMNT_0007647109 /DNA_START=50 /DNA_END=1177 /DNA_ORIENTATION=+
MGVKTAFYGIMVALAACLVVVRMMKEDGMVGRGVRVIGRNTVRMPRMRVRAEKSSSLDALSSMLGGLEPEKEVEKPTVQIPQPEISSESFNKLEAILSQPEVDNSKLAAELDSLRQQGILKKWGSASANLQSRRINMQQLQSVGLQKPENIAAGSVDDDLALLVVYVMASSVLAVIAGQVLPGQLGFFVPYLIGGSSLVLLTIGSTNPGLLQGPKEAIAKLNPEYERRLVRHEAAHFLTGYLLGIPVTDYDLRTPTGQSPHVEFAQFMEDGNRASEMVSKSELEKLGPLAMSGLAAEGLEFETVKGGQADLFQLQLLLDRSDPRLTPVEQQDFTRWSVFKAVDILKTNAKAHDKLTEKMTEGQSVIDCIKAVEGF